MGSTTAACSAVPEVAGGGVEGGVTEQGLDLGGIGTALAEPGGVSVAKPVRAEARLASVGADGEDDMGDAGGGEPAALTGP